jgi:ABC-type transport system involved in Fe-S cluster assembly fused permease/ATPase subunit
VLLITHRLAGLEGVNELIVLDGGHVVEPGCHSELLDHGGSYARVWAREAER